VCSRLEDLKAFQFPSGCLGSSAFARRFLAAEISARKKWAARTKLDERELVQGGQSDKPDYEMGVFWPAM
jgi:hypothetical protein